MGFLIKNSNQLNLNIKKNHFLISILDKKNMHVTGGILLKSIVGANHVYIV